MKKIILALGVVGLLSSSSFATDATTILNNNGCMSCHNIMGKKDAPAFMGVARRNMRFEGTNAKANIINSIKNGSKGTYRNFTNNEMPPYPNLSDSDLNTIADYILTLNNKRGMKGKGKGMMGNMK